jgi:quercetin dioxygenase-like cupin family protein
VKLSRRDLAILMPALAAAAPKPALPSKVYKHEELAVKVNGENKSRAILNGATHTGYSIEMHETELAPGLAPHPPHHHAHEEMLLLREGTMEITIAGKVSVIGPGSVVLVGSNDEHGWRNVGTTRAAYFVMALGRDA